MNLVGIGDEVVQGRVCCTDTAHLDSQAFARILRLAGPDGRGLDVGIKTGGHWRLGLGNLPGRLGRRTAED